MPSPIFAHVIGTLALLTIFFIAIVYTMLSTQNAIVYNQKILFERICSSIYLQLLYLLSIENDISIELYYPKYALPDVGYNIAIANGTYIMANYGFIKDLDKNTIYIAVIDPAYKNYCVLPLEYPKREITIILEKPMVFSSYTITIVEKKAIGKNIYVSYIIKGYR